MSETILVEKLPKILLIGNFLSKVYGTKGISEILAELLVERDWDVITSSSSKNRVSRMIEMVWVTLSKQKLYDIVHIDVFSGSAFLWAEIVAKILQIINKPYILTLRGGRLPEFSKQWSSRFHRLLDQASFVTTQSHFLLERFNRFRSDILYLPNGLHINSYPFRLRTQPKPRLIWLRALHQIYNPLLAVETIEILRGKYKNIHLHMIGPDKRDGTYNLLLDKIKRNNLSNQISITGPIIKEDVPNFLSDGDIFLNTTYYESFGVSVMEAAACGLPIVSTNVGELSFLWKHNHNALLLNAGDSIGMATEVDRVLNEPNLSKTLSENARLQAEKFDWSNILPIWERLFARIYGSA